MHRPWRDRDGVDRSRVCVGDFSDGGTYALSLGLVNGGLFTHVMAFSPGFLTDVDRQGKPRVFVAHGTEDTVLPIDSTSRVIVPRFRQQGYDVTYREFPGAHTVPSDVGDEAFARFAASPTSAVNRGRGPPKTWENGSL